MNQAVKKKNTIGMIITIAMQSKVLLDIIN